MKIWQKHLLLKLMKTFCFFLFCLFFIYVIIDLSAHGVRFFSKSTFFEIIVYYLNIFSTQFDFFLTLTFLLASMKVLINLTNNREILALQMANLSKKKLLTPFFAFGFFLCISGWINSEFFYQNAIEATTHFKSAYKSKKQSIEKGKLFTLSLEDETELIFKKFEMDQNLLVDVFWIQNFSDIWHMKSLDTRSMKARFVNHFSRDQDQRLIKQNSFEEKIFDQIPLDLEAIKSRFIGYEFRPISKLLIQAFSASSEKRIILSHLYYKILAILMPIIVIIVIANATMTLARQRATFLIVASFIFLFLALKIILDGMLILGENQVMPAFLALSLPVGIILASFLPKFIKMQ